MPQTRYIRWIPSAIAIKRIGRIHTLLYRVSRGKIGSRLDGLDMLLLTTTGKKSGIERTVPLPFFRDGSRFVLIASFGGNPNNPAWFNNLTANTAVEVQVGPKRVKALAIVAEGPERERLWRDITAEFPRYLNYQAKTERRIPIVVLQPIESAAAA